MSKTTISLDVRYRCVIGGYKEEYRLLADTKKLADKFETKIKILRVRFHSHIVQMSCFCPKKISFINENLLEKDEDITNKHLKYSFFDVANPNTSHHNDTKSVHDDATLRRKLFFWSREYLKLENTLHCYKKHLNELMLVADEIEDEIKKMKRYIYNSRYRKRMETRKYLEAIF